LGKNWEGGGYIQVSDLRAIMALLLKLVTVLVSFYPKKNTENSIISDHAEEIFINITLVSLCYDILFVFKLYFFYDQNKIKAQL
jgi:hypothetical protein